MRVTRALIAGLTGGRPPVGRPESLVPFGRHDHKGSSPSRSSPHLGQADPEEPLAAAQRRPVRRSLVHGELLVQGQVLEGELAVAPAEEGEETEQVEQEGDHRDGLSPDQRRQINHLPAGRSFGEGQGRRHGVGERGRGR